jgi:rSAM/selenodomain-associated transferase 2
MSSGFTALKQVEPVSAGTAWNAAFGTYKPRGISIIIPALNEAESLSSCLPDTLPEEVRDVILVDGGSTDQTCERAHKMGWSVMCSAPGRALQMNLGASAARGEVLLFLHADTQLPPDFALQIAGVLAGRGVVAGAFCLEIDFASPALRIIARMANFRSRFLRMPFGDQAIFVLASEFRAVGGYPEQPLMEDVELIRRLRRRGRIGLAWKAVKTSSRRWQRLGVWRTTLRNQLCQFAYCCGVSPTRLHRWYYGAHSTNSRNS